MGNTHDTEIARIEADYIQTKYRTTEDYRWGYTGDRGPDTWWIHYPSASGGMQSPVDIITEETTLAESECGWNPLQICYSTTTGSSRHAGISDADGEQCLDETKILVNTGNSSRVNVVNSRSYITGGPCKNYTYVLEQFHFHWGEEDKNGSEHHVNGRPYSAEVHLVHWNEDLYTSYEEAARNDDGIVILAVFVQVSETKNNDALMLWSQMLEDVVYREDNIPIPREFPVKYLLPDDINKFWTYQGSFTTPPCYETVTWIVFEKNIHVSSKVLSKFRTLRCYAENETRPEDEFDGLIQTNRRQIQPIGTRKVVHVDCNLFRSYHDQQHDNGNNEAGRPFRGSSLGVRIQTFQDYVGKHCRNGDAGRGSRRG